MTLKWPDLVVPSCALNRSPSGHRRSVHGWVGRGRRWLVQPVHDIAWQGWNSSYDKFLLIAFHCCMFSLCFLSPWSNLMVVPKKEMSSTAKSMLSVRITAPTLGDVLSFCPSEPATSVDELQRQWVFGAKKNNGQNKALPSDGKDMQRLSESKKPGDAKHIKTTFLQVFWAMFCWELLASRPSKPSKPSKLVHSLHLDLHSILFCHMNSSHGQAAQRWHHPKVVDRFRAQLC